MGYLKSLVRNTSTDITITQMNISNMIDLKYLAMRVIFKIFNGANI